MSALFRAGFIGRIALLVCVAVKSTSADPNAGVRPFAPLVYVEPGPVERSILYADGSEVEVETETVWKPVCGSDTTNLTIEDLKEIARISRLAAEAHPAPPVADRAVAGVGATGLDIQFNLTTAVPAPAIAALAEIERFVEAQFSDPVTVQISFAFAVLSPNVLGATSISYTSATWPNTRTGLQNGMDSNDTIQAFLPGGNFIPVRYTGTSANVTNEDRCFIARANYRATIGSVTGGAASMTFNSAFSWDYDPSDGITPGTFCFQSVIHHEVGHALGFASGADFRTNDMEMLDVYRFQRSDGAGTDYNPDTEAEFTTTARMIDQNAPLTDDDVNSDLISAEYRMSDGVPNQASHFRDQNPSIGIMDPTISGGATFFPNFLRTPDIAMFDAIGWDYPAENTFCGGAYEIECNATRSFDNFSYTIRPSPDYSCGSGVDHTGTFWYQFTASATSANVSTCEGVGDDSTLAVFAGACGSLVEIACSEDGGCGAGGTLPNVCVTGLNIGETYFIQVSARTSADRGVYELKLDCSCVGACCIPHPGGCLELQEDDCLALNGRFAGGGTACTGDTNGDGLDDACEQPEAKFSQIPTAGGEDLASNIDWTDMAPNVVLADDFTSDGRPIRSVRWWGSQLDAGVTVDGWFISFHEPLVLEQAAAAPLGLYFCAPEAVQIASTPIPACDFELVSRYEAELADCCLIHANADGRSTLTPAEADGFFEELCFDYDLDIQAVVGRRFDEDLETGACIETVTGNVAGGDFWGWHSTANEKGTHGAYVSLVTMAGGDWLYGPWSAAVPTCSAANMAFELLTTTPGGSGDASIWDNGLPNGDNGLNSQFGGERADQLTVDDVDFPEGATINDLHFLNEEESAFTWSGRVRLEIYPDTGAGAPDESGGPTVAMWIPDDGGSVSRTDLGPGQFLERFQYDVTGLSIALAPGVWWIGLATADNPGGTGQAYWLTSHTQQTDLLFFGAEAHNRFPSGGIPTFQPWSNFIGGLFHDVSFTVTATRTADCNCNSVPDDVDVSGGSSFDCNGNGIPDECEFDCNSNGVPDDCDVAVEDCQANGTPDECDILFGPSLDVNEDGVPDECCLVANAPQSEPGGFGKNRSLSLVPGHPGRMTAIRVRLTSLHDPDPPYTGGSAPFDYSTFVGQVRWLGPPSEYVESSSSSTLFTASILQCGPHFMDWGVVGLVHVFGTEVIPSSAYDVQTIDSTCSASLDDESSYSGALPMTTARWGDVVAPFNPPSETTQPDVSDFGALVDKFGSREGAPIKARAHIEPNLPDIAEDVNFEDIAAGVDAFRGRPYPFPGPDPPCP